MNITDVLQPSEIKEHYERLTKLINDKTGFEKDKMQVEKIINLKLAQGELDGIFDGKNAEARQNQKYAYTQDYQDKLFDIDVLLNFNDAMIKEVLHKIDMCKTIIKYFEVIEN